MSSLGLPDSNAVVLFDGCCNLCSASVDFIIRNDPRHRFRFAAEQSEAGRAILQRYGLEADSLDTLVLVENGGVHMRSDAILRIARRLKWPWPLAFGLVVVPRPLRDPVYGLVARTRYRTFGRRQACRMPRPEEAAFFITNAE